MTQTNLYTKDVRVITVLETGVHLKVFVDAFTDDDSASDTAKASAFIPCASPSQTVLHIPSSPVKKRPSKTENFRKSYLEECLQMKRIEHN